MGDDRLDVPRFQKALEKMANQRGKNMPRAGEPLATLMGDILKAGGLSPKLKADLNADSASNNTKRPKPVIIFFLVLVLESIPRDIFKFKCHTLILTNISFKSQQTNLFAVRYVF